MGANYGFIYRNISTLPFYFHPSPPPSPHFKGAFATFPQGYFIIVPPLPPAYSTPLLQLSTKEHVALKNSVFQNAIRHFLFRYFCFTSRSTATVIFGRISHLLSVPLMPQYLKIFFLIFSALNELKKVN